MIDEKEVVEVIIEIKKYYESSEPEEAYDGLDQIRLNIWYQVLDRDLSESENLELKTQREEYFS